MLAEAPKDSGLPNFVAGVDQAVIVVETPNFKYSTLGTLCDDPNGLTCSFDVAQRWGRAKEIVPYSTFEQAAEAVKIGGIQSFLVTAAYVNVYKFIMDAELLADEVFLMKIPDLVLAGREEKQPSNTDVVFYHPSTAPLLDEIETIYTSHKPVTSNSRACVELFETPGSIAITNRLCADHYKLNIYQVLRKSMTQPWISFVKAA